MAESGTKIEDNTAEKRVEERVKKEKNRLKRIYKEMPKDRLSVAQGLIEQAARMKISLDDLWKDICENGDTELFSQSEKTEPYERERPAARLFNSRNREYANIIKQLDSMLPQKAIEPKKEDEFTAFLSRRA